MSKLTTTVKQLNSAYTYFKKSLILIEKTTKKSTDMDTLIWRVKKSFDELQKEIYKQLEKDTVDDTFKGIIKKFKKL